MAGIVNTSNGPTKPYVDGKVQSEENRATTAEQALQGAITAEQSRAEAEETLIRGEIQTAAETAADAVSAERTRAESAESGLSTAISTEQSRAEAAEQNLRSDLQSEVDRATVAESNLSSAISAEESRAQTSEQAIVQSIENLVGVNNGASITLGTISQEVLDQANGYTNDQITQRVTQVYTVKGSCTYSELLSKTGQETGNIWNVTTPNGHQVGNTWQDYTQGDSEYIPPGTNYVWTGTTWDAMGGTIDLSPYEFTNDVNTKLNTFTNTTDLNTVLEKHQNRIVKRQVEITSSDAVGDPAGVAKTVDGVTGDSTEILLVSPTVESSDYATNMGLRAVDAGRGSITFKADAAYPSGVPRIIFDITIIDTSAGVGIKQQPNYPVSNS